MKTWMHIAIFMVIAYTTVMASPLDMIVDSEDQIKKIGAKVVCKSGEKEVSIQIEWKPLANGKDDPQPRLDMVFSEDKQHWGDDSLNVRFEKDAKGMIRADFTVSKARIDSVFLVFWGATPDYVYHLSIRTVVDGYKLVDPFKIPKGAQGDADQPATQSRQPKD